MGGLTFTVLFLAFGACAVSETKSIITSCYAYLLFSSSLKGRRFVSREIILAELCT